jgi:pyridoxal phosphate enzyme (YggS family)
MTSCAAPPSEDGAGPSKRHAILKQKAMPDNGLSDRIAAVRERMARAAERARRDPSGITLLAVTKVFPAASIRDAYDLGLREFGENYVQEFETKAPEVGALPGARFHLIGHLQSNKSRKAAELFQVVQTVDSPKLARRLDESAQMLEVMLEIKLSAEDAKSGADPAELPGLIETVRTCPNLRLLGLMTMPPWSDDPEASRPYFRRLRELAERHGLTQLSMGMSHDLETAIEEGATCVRVGTALFGKRKKT